jgi:hypothetical protein
MNRIATLPYDELKFFWVNSHYDIHLSGLCKIGNTIFYFKTINSNEYYDDETELMCDVYMLSFSEEIKWRLRKFFFEQMVGYHWSYPQKKEWARFYYRRPVWLSKLLFKLYYKIKKIYGK